VLLSAVSCGLRHLATTPTDGLPRMADFAQWVIAAEPTLGWESGMFLTTYQANRAGANDLALDASLVGQALLSFIEPGATWTGTAKELLEQLNEKYPYQKEQRGWPANARSLSNAIRTIATNLRAAGFAVPSQPKRSNRARTWDIHRSEDTGNFASPPSLASPKDEKPENKPPRAAEKGDAKGDARSDGDAKVTQAQMPLAPDVSCDSDASDTSDARIRTIPFDRERDSAADVLTMLDLQPGVGIGIAPNVTLHIVDAGQVAMQSNASVSAAASIALGERDDADVKENSGDGGRRKRWSA
jgi:uncharacterized protein YukE